MKTTLYEARPEGVPSIFGRTLSIIRDRLKHTSLGGQLLVPVYQVKLEGSAADLLNREHSVNALLLSRVYKVKTQTLGQPTREDRMRWEHGGAVASEDG